MILVDEIRRFPTAIPCFKRGSCHLTVVDDEVDALHAFAERLGLKREWFQEHVIAPHYDLTPRKRERALRLGAIFVPGRVQVRLRKIEGEIKSAWEAQRTAGERRDWDDTNDAAARLDRLHNEKRRLLNGTTD